MRCGEKIPDVVTVKTLKHHILNLTTSVFKVYIIQFT